jgi:hypothetical protein
VGSKLGFAQNATHKCGDGVRLGQGALPVDVNGRVENRLGEFMQMPVNEADGMQIGLRQAAQNQVQYIVVACE